MFVDIGGIVDHHSMSWGERWFLLILVELLSIIQWVEVRGDFGWYWWNCWPSLNEFRWEVIFVDIVELLTIIQWVEVRGDFCWYWWNCWPSLNELRLEVILLILVELLTITQCIEMRGDFCWYWWNCWPSLNVIRWEVIFCWYWWICWPSLNVLWWEVIVVDIGEIVDHHSMYWDEMWFLLILVELLTITQWVEVKDVFCWYWWNCWP